HEDDAAILVLQDVAVVSLVNAGHNDVATLDETEFFAGVAAAYAVEHLGGPGSRRIDERARGHDRCRRRAHIEERHVPLALLALCRNAARSGANVGTAFARVDGVQHNKSGIVHAAVRISKARRQMVLERGALLGRAEIEAARAAQEVAPREPKI